MSLYSCIQVAFSRVGELACSFRREGGRLSCSARPVPVCAFGFKRVGGMSAMAVMRRDMVCAFGLICATSLGDDWPLWASDQMVLTVDGGKVYVTKVSD